MRKISSISTLITSTRSKKDVVSWNGNRKYLWPEFCENVAELTGRIERQGGKDYLLACDDAYAFAVGFFATLYAGCNVVFPANLQLGHLEKITKTMDGILVSDDSKAPITSNKKMPIFSSLEQASSQHPPSHEIPKTIKLYTSGSSGVPTVVVKSIQCLEAEITTLEKNFENENIKNIIATVPPYHIYGLLFRVLWPLLSNRAFAANNILHPGELMHQTSVKQGVALISSPAFLKRVLPVLDLNKLNTSLFGVFSSGGPLDSKISAAYNKTLKHPIIEVYGSTETGGIAYRSVFEPAPTTYWTPLDKVELRASKDNHLLVKSPHLEKEDWHQTDDIVLFNDKGAFELKGRADRIIKIEEQRISLTEIERSLQGDKFISSSYVVPIQNQSRDILAAIIVPTEEGWQKLLAVGKQHFVKGLRQKLSHHLPTSARPKRWRFIARAPANAQGKITQAALKALFSPHPTEQTMPEILSQENNDDQYTFNLNIPKDLIYFRGHFATFPILPGVVQVDWVIHFARSYLSINTPFKKMKNIKFSKIIKPQSNITLHLLFDATKQQLNFSYTSKKHTHSSGRILFEAEI